MKVSTGQFNQYFCQLIVEELYRCGVDYFCLSPGSRSTPLTVAVAEHDNVTAQIFHDERAAAFHALGYARATNRPAVLICTSGTAVANYLPAVVEASMDMVPMIILTADRPPELCDCGANQAIKQPGIFTDIVRWQCDMPCPDEKIAPEFVLTTIDQAFHRSTISPPGPVHINCRFREPFLPFDTMSESIADNLSIGKWRTQQQPFTLYEQPCSALSEKQISSLSDTINNAASGLLVVGRLRNQAERTAVVQFAQKLGWPLLPDISSGLRLGAECDHMIPHYDLLLRSAKRWNIERPSVAMHLSGRVVSKRLTTFLKDVQFDEFLHVADHPFRHDWQHQVTQRFQCTPESFCTALVPQLSPKTECKLQTQLHQASRRVGELVRRTIDDDDTLTEPRIARIISKHIPANSGLFIANSLPIRLMDSFADFIESDNSDNPLPGCNRGASGIDGTIATATGYSSGLGRPTTLLIGDLAFLHDLNSLALVRKLKHPMIIVLVNNDGGGIFSLLPIAERKDVFESYFTAPHGLKFIDSAGQFGLKYYAPATPEEFRKCYSNAVTSNHSSLIEIVTQRDDTRNLYHRILAEVEETKADK